VTATDTPGALGLQRLSGVGELRADWSRLAEAADNPFVTPEWAEAWLRHVPEAISTSFWACRRPDGSVAAVLPLVVVGGRYVRKLRFVGYGAANELGPVCAPADLEDVAAALLRVLAGTRPEWDLFVGESLPGDGWAGRLEARLVSSEPSPVVQLPAGGWEEYLASRSANFRQELRRKERRLAEQGIRFRTVQREAELEPALDTLFRLHRLRWGSEASPFFAGLEAFHREFAAVALERGWLRLRLAEGDDGAVAVNHGFRFGDAEWGYQIGRDPSDRTSSVGLILFAHSVREAIAEGAATFRLGPGRQPYKLRLATEDRGLETVAVVRSLRGRAALLALRRRSRPPADADTG
jgi:CelD/BcsL family acetyltransferase involved in cellulose biosynthesis